MGGTAGTIVSRACVLACSRRIRVNRNEDVRRDCFKRDSQVR